ncbi:hypothetical protein Dsin_018485 [Dipteronia sinensis]|uniref:RNase H type-1 domain-containing protein n=1 Tax=Dipteronia sinensis TaxID=43782 RepID=A0AAE0A670_9ROSI|nr:hypothetical protein Dsin_018485 [Dipteronia sinensis]
MDLEVWKRRSISMENGDLRKRVVGLLLGSGTKASFWNDVRVDNVSLKYSFPRIYALSIMKNGPVSNFGAWRGSTWTWKVPLRRNLFGWELSQWSCFCSFIDCIKIRSSIEDDLAWNFSLNGIFTVSSFCRAIEVSRTNTRVWTTFVDRGCALRKWKSLYGSCSKIVARNQNLSKRNTVEDWIPPNVNGLKFNVDGLARGNPGPAGIGGVLKDNKGKVVCLFSLFVGIRDSNEAELRAIEKAAQLCASNSAMVGRDITIVSDSKVTVSWINEEVFGNLSLVDMVYDVSSYLATLEGASVSFAPRASNSFADSLAKLVSHMSRDFI